MAREAKTYDARIVNTDASEVDTLKKALRLLVGMNEARGEMEEEELIAECVVRYARRELALYKDQARKQAGLAAAHKYTPDLSNVEDEKVIREAAGFLVEVADTFSEAAVEAHKASLAAKRAASKKPAPAPVEPQPAPEKKARKSKKAAPVEPTPAQ